MGVKHLMKVLQELYAESFCERSVETLAGMRLAVDASLVFYQIQTAIKGKIDGIRNKENKDVTHLVGMLNKLAFFQRHGVRPVFVFDGPPPEEKRRVLNQRSASRNKAQEELKEEAVAADRQGALRQRAVRMDAGVTSDIIRLLELLDIPYIMAEGEADAVCVALQERGAVDMVLSDDSDVFLYGAKRVVRKLGSKNQTYQLVDLPSSVQTETLVAAGVALGCDYSPGIKGIGMKRTIEAIRQGTLLNLVLSTGHKNEYEMLVGIFRPTKPLEYKVQRPPRHENERTQAEEVKAFLEDTMSLETTKIQRILATFFPPVWS
jgi:flap endonuclease-1